jgi:hypothetical protein
MRAYLLPVKGSYGRREASREECSSIEVLGVEDDRTTLSVIVETSLQT